MPTNCSVIKAERPQLPFEDVGFFDVLTTTDFTKWLGHKSVSGAALLSGCESLPFCARWTPSGTQFCALSFSQAREPQAFWKETGTTISSISVSCHLLKMPRNKVQIRCHLKQTVKGSLRQEVGSPTGLTWGLMLLSCLWGVWSRTLWHLSRVYGNLAYQPVTREETRSEL